MEILSKLPLFELDSKAALARFIFEQSWKCVQSKQNLVKDGIEKVEATYETFMKQKNLKYFMSYFVEFQTGAVQNLLNPERIKEYLKIVKVKVCKN